MKVATLTWDRGENLNYSETDEYEGDEADWLAEANDPYFTELCPDEEAPTVYGYIGGGRLYRTWVEPQHGQPGFWAYCLLWPD